MPEHALDAFSSLSRTSLSLGSDEGTDLVAGVLIDQPCDGALSGCGTLRLQQAPSAIRRTTAVAAHLAGSHCAPIGERLVGRAAVRVGNGVVRECVSHEEAVALAGAIDHRDVRSYVSRDQPAQQWSIAIRLVRSEA